MTMADKGYSSLMVIYRAESMNIIPVRYHSYLTGAREASIGWLSRTRKKPAERVQGENIKPS